MILDFTPVRMDADITLEVRGDLLHINDEVIDFSGLVVGEVMPWDEIGNGWIASDAVREESGQVRVTVILPCGPFAPKERTFAPPRTITDDGPVLLPPFGEG